MKKSKKVLLFKLLIIPFFTLSIIRVLSFNISYKLYESDGSNFGTVTMITKKEGYTVLSIKSNINYKAYIYSDTDLDYGDIISFDYVNKDTYKNTIFNTFNYKKYLKSKNIKQVIEIKEYNKIKTNNYYKYKGFVYKKILSRKSRNYIFTFLCGDKSYLDNDVKMSFTDNGISHLLCISGFHIVFLFDIFKYIFSLKLKKDKLMISIILTISIVYLMLTNFMIALFRAVIMYFLSYIKRKFEIRINPIYILIFTLFLSLSIFPNVIYDIGFYYTFIISFFLIFHVHRISLSNIFKTTLYCIIISSPITIYTNCNINLLSVLMSVFSSFYVCYILYPLSFIAVFSRLADGILYRASSIFEMVNLKVESINFFRIIIPKINIILVIFIYLLFILYLLFHNKYIFYTYLLLLIYMVFGKYIDKSTYVYYLDVKQGDMSIIVDHNFKNITVIDTGGIVNDNYMKYTIRQFLYSIGVNKINSLILTHGDHDHMGEAINLVNNFKVEKVIFNCGEFNDLEQELIKILDRKKIKYYSCIKELNINNNKLYFLQTKEYDNENDNSNVIYTELNGYKFMFMGDAGIEKEKDILEKYNISDIDILKVGHHGSKTSSSIQFINEINPKYSIISVGKNNRYGHPNKEVLDNLKESIIYRTDQDGSIMLKIKNNKLKIETCIPSKGE